MTKLIKMTRLPHRHFICIWGSEILMAAGIMGAAIGLSWLDSLEIRPSRASDRIDEPGSGVTLSVEVLQLWLPETMVDLASKCRGSSVPSTHQELRALLERRGLEEVWYLLAIRNHQVNGGVADITFIRYPYRDLERFREFLDVLATAAGNPPSNPSWNYADAEIHILPSEVSHREPLGVVAELSSLPCSSLEPLHRSGSESRPRN